jgi:hypothetical protein
VVVPESPLNSLLDNQPKLLTNEDPFSDSSSNVGPASSDNGVLQCANLFFSGIQKASETICHSKRAFSTNLSTLMSGEVSELLNEVKAVLKEAQMTFRKNRFVFLLCSACLRVICCFYFLPFLAFFMSIFFL